MRAFACLVCSILSFTAFAESYFPDCTPDVQDTTADVETYLNSPAGSQLQRFLLATKGRVSSNIGGDRIPVHFWTNNALWNAIRENTTKAATIRKYMVTEHLKRGIWPSPWITDMNSEDCRFEVGGKHQTRCKKNGIYVQSRDGNESGVEPAKLLFDSNIGAGYDLRMAAEVFSNVVGHCQKAVVIAPGLPGQIWGSGEYNSFIYRDPLKTSSDKGFFPPLPNYSTIKLDVFYPEMKRRLGLIHEALGGPQKYPRAEWLFGLFSDYEDGPFPGNSSYEAQKEIMAKDLYPDELAAKFKNVDNTSEETKKTTGEAGYRTWVAGLRQQLLKQALDRPVRELQDVTDSPALVGNYRSIDNVSFNTITPVVYAEQRYILQRLSPRSILRSNGLPFTAFAYLYDSPYDNYPSDAFYYGRKHALKTGDEVLITNLSAPGLNSAVRFGLMMGKRYLVEEIDSVVFRLIDPATENLVYGLVPSDPSVPRTNAFALELRNKGLADTPITIEFKPTADLKTMSEVRDALRPRIKAPRAGSVNLHALLWWRDRVYFGHAHGLKNDTDYSVITLNVTNPNPDVTFAIAEGERYRVRVIDANTVSFHDWQTGALIPPATTSKDINATKARNLLSQVTLELVEASDFLLESNKMSPVSQRLVDAFYFETLFATYQADTWIRRANPALKIMPWVTSELFLQRGDTEATVRLVPYRYMSGPRYKNLLHHMIALGGIHAVGAFALFDTPPNPNAPAWPRAFQYVGIPWNSQERMNITMAPLNIALEVLDEVSPFKDLVRNGAPITDSVPANFASAASKAPFYTASTYGNQTIVRASSYGVEPGEPEASTGRTVWVSPFPGSGSYPVWAAPHGMSYVFTRNGARIEISCLRGFTMAGGNGSTFACR